MSGSEYGLVAVSSEHGNAAYGSTEYRNLTISYARILLHEVN
jgi:hypothetical protein